MSDDKRNRLKQWLESGEVRLAPLTLPQRELWEATPVPVADVANHICCLIWVRGSILPDEARAAVQRVVDRQEVLRLSFLRGKEQPLQMIRRSHEANFTHRQLSSTQAHPEAIEELAGEVFSQPFDLVQGPLYRVVLLTRSPEEHVLVFAVHHAIADGWTLGVFVQDLCTAYLQEIRGVHTPLPPVPLAYTNWGAAERAVWQPAEVEQRAAFWRPLLADRPLLWKPSTGAEAVTGPLQRSVFHIPAPLGRSVRELARRNGATLFNTLLTAFQATIAGWTGQQDIIVGTPVANRSKPIVRETMGYFAGVVPLRGQVDPAMAFADRLRLVHQSTVDAFANAMPFAELARALGEPLPPAYHPIYQIRFALQNHPMPDVNLPGMSVRLRMRSTGTARFDLGCEVTEENDALEVVWLFRPYLFSESDIQTLDGRFQGVLADACRAPDRRPAVAMA